MGHSRELVIVLTEPVFITLFKPISKIGHMSKGWYDQGPCAWDGVRTPLAGSQHKCIFQPACHRLLQGGGHLVPLPRAHSDSLSASPTRGAVAGAHGPAGVGSTDHSERALGSLASGQGPCVTSPAPGQTHKDTENAAAAGSDRGEVSSEDTRETHWASCSGIRGGSGPPHCPHLVWGHEVPPRMQATGPAGQVLLLGSQGPSASTSP